MTIQQLTAISLFSSAGIGDLALRDAGAEVIVANELLEDRVALFQTNFPDCKIIPGDIRSKKAEVIAETLSILDGERLDLLFATPPCQGMSKNGRGKLLSVVRNGGRPELDDRNSLILEVIEIALALRPRMIILENVSEMRDTVILYNGELRNIIELLSEAFADAYIGRAEVVEFADYGVPQRRKRLITTFIDKGEKASAALASVQHWLPARTHAQSPTLLTKPWVTVMDAVGRVPALDAGDAKSAKDAEILLHRVPLLDDEKYFWVSNTPPGKGAFDNQCVNPNCGFDGNQRHGSSSSGGINQSLKSTPVRCSKCDELLPRPWVKRNGDFVIMSGFTSAYKRMRGDLPASALTKNLSYACSDQKLHPFQNRVLSLHEATILHTIDQFAFDWRRADGKKVSDKLVREVIGESIPPAGLQKIFIHLFETLSKSAFSSIEDKSAIVS